jgi:hypothetical protein
MEEYTNQIKAYINQLSELGFYTFQIDRIVREAIGTSNLNKISGKQALNLMETLAEHIQFAVKCRRIS